MVLWLFPAFPRESEAFLLTSTPSLCKVAKHTKVALPWQDTWYGSLAFSSLLSGSEACLCWGRFQGVLPILSILLPLLPSLFLHQPRLPLPLRGHDQPPPCSMPQLLQMPRGFLLSLLWKAAYSAVAPLQLAYTRVLLIFPCTELGRTMETLPSISVGSWVINTAFLHEEY